MSRPSWSDNPLPDPVPEAWAAVVALIRADVDRYAGGDRHQLSRRSWALTLLSLRPDGDWAFPRSRNHVVEPATAFAAPPEFVPFVELDGHRTGYVGYGRSTSGYLGWLVPAPELGRADHPVGLLDLDTPATVDGMGDDTRAGLARYFTLLSFLDMPEWYGMDSSEGGYAGWMRQVGDDIERVWNALELQAPPMPDLTDLRAPRPSWSGLRPRFPVPEGWRHEPGADNVGVLAPAGAFAAEPPEVPRRRQPEALDQAPADAERLLRQGAPASALLVVKNAFARGESDLRRRRTPEQQRDVDRLRPLWENAYADLGRPQLADRVALVTSPDRWRH